MYKKLLLLLSFSGFYNLAQAQANPYPLVSIDTFGFVTASKLSANNTKPDYIDPFKNTTYTDTVQVEGYVTFNPMTYGLSSTQARFGCFLQKTPTIQPWGGIHVLLDRGLYPGDSINGLDQVVKYFANFNYGLKVKATGKLSEFSGMSQMALIRIESEITDLNVANIQPKLLTVADFEKNIGGTQTYQPTTGEQWEGGYIELRNVTVVDRSPSGSRWNWSLQDANGNKMKVYDVSGYFRNDNFDRDPATPVAFAPPPAGTTLSFVRGVVMEVVSGGITGYYIAPLLPTDIGPSTFIPPTISNRRHIPVIATSSDPVKLSCTAIDDSTVTNATLYYAVGATNNTYTSVAMTDMGGGKYEATVPAQANGTVVKYWFRAWDNGGHNSVDTSSNALAYIVTDGGINTIAQIQYSPFSGGASIWAGDTLTGINIGGIVTASYFDMSNYPAIQNGSAPNSGIFFKAIAGDSVANWRRGDSIIINSCVVTEDFSVTTLSRIGVYGSTRNFTKVSSYNDMPSFITTLPIDSVIAKVPAHTEPYEGMLVRYNDAYCVSKNPDITTNNGEFSIYKDTSTVNGLRCDDDSKDIGSTYNVDSMVLKTKKYGFIQGVLYFSFSNWKLEPRDRADIDHNDRTAPLLLLIGSDTIHVAQNATFNDPGAKAYDNFDGNSVTVTVSGSVNTAVPGTYVLKYDATDAAGNKAIQLTRIVIVDQGIGMNKTEAIKASVYPNPAENQLNIVFNSGDEETIDVTITDISGKQVAKEAVVVARGGNKITYNTSKLSKGMYIITIKLSDGNITERFIK
jgi:hypothetical protein